MTEFQDWFRWVQQLQTIAQAGLTYTQNAFDRERYLEVQHIAAEILAAGTNNPIQETSSLLSLEKGYATPKLDVRGVVLQEGKVLLVKELLDGKWTLPGGWVDVGEAPSRAVEREVWEESGYLVRASKLLALYDRQKHGFPAYLFHIYKLFFLCELEGGEATDSIETEDASFFDRHALPPLSLGRTTEEVLERLFQLTDRPDAPTDFD